MIKKFIAILFLIWAIVGSAQTYHPFLELNKVWTVEWANYMAIPPIVYQITYTYLGDTVINSIEYKNYGTIIREDTVLRKVYLYEDGYPNDECLLYDFNAQPGDTLDVCNFGIVIDSVSTIQLLTGELRNIFYYSGTVTGEYYIEGIGSNEGFEYLSEPIGPPAYDLMCVKQDTIEIFGDRCDQVVGLGEIVSSESFVNFYPNPAEDFLNIENSKDIETFWIFDLMGRDRLHGKITSNKIYFNSLSSGFYIIVFRDINNRLVDIKRVIIRR